MRKTILKRFANLGKCGKLEYYDQEKDVEEEEKKGETNR